MLPPVLSTLKRHFKEAKAELQGQAISRGRRVKPLSEINSGERDKLAGCQVEIDDVRHEVRRIIPGRELAAQIISGLTKDGFLQILHEEGTKLALGMRSAPDLPMGLRTPMNPAAIDQTLAQLRGILESGRATVHFSRRMIEGDPVDGCETWRPSRHLTVTITGPTA